MVKAVIFGGTTEGRKLCELCSELKIPVLYCVATPDGARPVQALPNINIRTGRLDAAQMADLLERCKPALVIDATHPYAEEAGINISAACEKNAAPLVRICRESAKEQDCVLLGSLDELCAWLEKEPGNVFVTTGSSSAKALAGLPDYRERIWLRILPSLDSLYTCLNLGYRPERLICMQGPFSEELNRAMFKAANARILVTKDSGTPGGFPEKTRAAKSLGMITAVLSKPGNTEGISLEEAFGIILELGT